MQLKNSALLDTVSSPFRNNYLECYLYDSKIKVINNTIYIHIDSKTQYNIQTNIKDLIEK